MPASSLGLLAVNRGDVLGFGEMLGVCVWGGDRISGAAREEAIQELWGSAGAGTVLGGGGATSRGSGGRSPSFPSRKE